MQLEDLLRLMTTPSSRQLKTNPSINTPSTFRDNEKSEES